MSLGGPGFSHLRSSAASITVCPDPQKVQNDASCHKKVAFSTVTEVISFTELYNNFPEFQTLYR
jgi:hypothetical protein